jgi:hypothetical protein
MAYGLDKEKAHQAAQKRLCARKKNRPTREISSAGDNCGV